MNTLVQFKTFYDEICSSNSRKYKQEVLQKYKDDEVIQRYLKIAFDPYTVYGVSIKKLSKDIQMTSDWWPSTVFELFEYLEKHNTGRDRDVFICQLALESVAMNDPEAANLLVKLICKDISIGCDAKTINKEIPDLIPTFSVQLANKYFDKPGYVEGKPFAITTKIDGGRIIALKENGQVSFFTRAGQKYEGLVDLESEMLRLMPDNTCLDGEITLLDRGNLSSKDAYKETMKIVRTKDKEKHGIKILVFDYMSAEDFRKVIDVDLNAPFIVSKAVIPSMLKKGAGKIINICSMMSELGRETVSAYAAAKGGLKMLTRNICSEYGEYNIQCNGIGPGYIATPQTAPLRERQADGSRHPFDSFICAKTPANRWLKPEELAKSMNYNDKIAILFGREGNGLTNAEIEARIQKEVNERLAKLTKMNLLFSLKIQFSFLSCPARPKILPIS